MTLLALADRETPAFRRAFQYALARASLAVTDEHLTDAYATGTPAYVVASIPWLLFEAEFTRSLEPAYRHLLGQAGKLDLRKAAQPFGFNTLNPRATQWILAHSGDLVRNVSEGSKNAIRQQVLRMFQMGVSPSEVATDLRRFLGLSQRDASALWNFQSHLQYQLQDGDITARQLVERVERKRTELIAHRATVIARTEALTAANEGQQEAWRQAVEQGYLDPDRKRVWLVTPDERLCPICAPVTGRGPVGLTEAFLMGDGSTRMVPPAHPQCRCTVALA